MYHWIGENPREVAEKLTGLEFDKLNCLYENCRGFRGILRLRMKEYYERTQEESRRWFRQKVVENLKAMSRPVTTIYSDGSKFSFSSNKHPDLLVAICDALG
ncbi:hypothetical protein COU61_04250 [Candidatus Pacearchaeota archaeon CG10_big_fil_rev_8_21_14_0_10_35_13]|nr:MAG: hypothetical protein COU61_04250 [Candidatus Pacearchaeota archaeon CG10_big_fil_rev_8_21_14_0_10_35_13]